MKVIKLNLSFFSFLFLISASWAQDTPKILDLNIVGNKNVSESAIIAKIKAQRLLILDKQRSYDPKEVTSYDYAMLVTVRLAYDKVLELIEAIEINK